MQNQATHHPLRDSTRAALSHHLSEAAFEDALSTLEADGFVVFESVMTTDQINAVREALEPHFDRALRGRNDFEGFSTHREYALMGKQHCHSTPSGTQRPSAAGNSHCVINCD